MPITAEDRDATALKLKVSKVTGNFSTEPYVRRIDKPWGWEIHWTPDGLPYMGKILHFKRGHRFSLQRHDEKMESWFLMSGRALLSWENSDGEMVDVEMEPGKGYNLDVGQKHRIKGITDCDVVEVSMPEIGNTFRLEDDYSRAGITETPEEREKRNQGVL